MLPGWLVIAIFLAYAAALLALAGYGERVAAEPQRPRLRRAVYALSSCVLFSAGSYMGGVGTASRRGIDFLPPLVGPIVMFAVFYPVIVRMIRIAKTQSLTSVADFVAVRYGRSGSVAATVTIIGVLACVPFMAIEIKAIGKILTIFIDGRLPTQQGPPGSFPMVTAAAAALVAGMTMLIGARRVDATEHQSGLMMVLAAEAAIKLLSFIAVGIFVCWGLNKGIGDLTAQVARRPDIEAVVDAAPNFALWLPLILVTMGATLIMPRQFHVSIVENLNEADVRTAAWVVPIYIIAGSIFVLPLAVAGLATFASGTLDRDFTMIALPLQAGSSLVTVIALVGSFAAATAGLIASALAIAVMTCNDLVVPLLLWLGARRGQHQIVAPPILLIRRIAIAAILAAASLVAVCFANVTMATLDLTAVVSAAQIAPATIGALLWSGATARGAVGGMLAGLATCAYTLLLPASVPHSPLVTVGPLGIDALNPTALFGIDLAPLQQGIVWSLVINVLVYVTLSLTRRPNTNERLQANVFIRAKMMAQATSFRLRHANVSVGELLATVSRFLGLGAAEKLFLEHHVTRNLPFNKVQAAEPSLVQYAEHLIASTIGAASARTVISLLIEQKEVSRDAARKIVDDVAFEIQNSRDLLQHAIDIARDGMSIFDADLRLVAWNRAYGQMFLFPAGLLRVGVPLETLIRSNAARGIYGQQGNDEDFVAMRLEVLSQPTRGLRMLAAPFGRVLDMRSVRLHNGGLFFTYSDATAQAQSEEELEAENLTLELRVRERTEELERLNLELLRAKAEAEDANFTKSRFLAAASHDVLQPLSAARLYAASLRERLGVRFKGDEAVSLAANVDQSLEAVEEVMSALLEISQLDAGATTTDVASFALQPLLNELRIDFEPLAIDKGLRLTFVATRVHVRSDRRLLRRLLQNLVSNALKYTLTGGVLIGVRRIGQQARIEVHDTGLGIPADKLQLIFREFQRLPAGAQVATGAGLGLSIVERLSRMLQHDMSVRSIVGRGSTFSVQLPYTPGEAVAVSTAPAAVPRQGQLDGLVVAAIDNESQILSGLEALLRDWGCVVARGFDLAEVEAALAARRLTPNAIVADYHIGEMDGLGVIAALRARYGRCPAVLVTADHGSHVRDLAQLADVRVLNKPLKPATLRSLLAQWRLVNAAAE